MNILLTNDDGIDTPGLNELASVLRSDKNISLSIVAPEKNRSGVSHSISIFLSSVTLNKRGDKTWSCSGTPVDCVIAALLGTFSEKPDLVISGINQGANLGSDIIYSGTASAARQASLLGFPALALSLQGKEPYNWDMAVNWVKKNLEEICSYWKKNSFINVNIPNGDDAPIGLVHTWPGIKKYNDKLSEDKTEDGLVCSLLGGGETVIYEAGSDCDAVSGNYASLSTIYNFPVVYKETCSNAPDYASVTIRS